MRLTQQQALEIELVESVLTRCSVETLRLDLDGWNLDEMLARVRDAIAKDDELADAEYEADKRADQIVEAMEGRR